MMLGSPTQTITNYSQIQLKNDKNKVKIIEAVYIQQNNHPLLK